MSALWYNLMLQLFFVFFNIYLHLPQTRTQSPTQGQVYLHDHIHSSGNWVPTETQQRGRLPTPQSIRPVSATLIYLLVNFLAFFSLLPYNHHPFWSSLPPSLTFPHLSWLYHLPHTKLPLSSFSLPPQVCKHIWLGLYDDRTSVVPDFREPQKVKEFLQEKYEKKRW